MVRPIAEWGLQPAAAGSDDDDTAAGVVSAVWHDAGSHLQDVRHGPVQQCVVTSHFDTSASLQQPPPKPRSPATLQGLYLSPSALPTTAVFCSQRLRAARRITPFKRSSAEAEGTRDAPQIRNIALEKACNTGMIFKDI